MKTDLEKPSGSSPRTEADVLRDEVLVARRASEITAELVVAQFVKMEEALRIVEEKATGEHQLRERLAEELGESERRERDLAEARQAAEEARAVAEQANRERGALLDEMVRQNQYLAALHDTTVGLMSRLDVNELLETLVTRAGQLLSAPHGFIYLAEPGETELECRVGVGALSQSVGSHRKRGEGLAGRIWQTGEPLVVDDYAHWPGHVDDVHTELLGAMMGVPLTSGDQAMGAIGLAHDPGTNRTFGKEELEVLS